MSLSVREINLHKNVTNYGIFKLAWYFPQYTAGQVGLCSAKIKPKLCIISVHVPPTNITIGKGFKVLQMVIEMTRQLLWRPVQVFDP